MAAAPAAAKRCLHSTPQNLDLDSCQQACGAANGSAANGTALVCVSGADGAGTGGAGTGGAAGLRPQALVWMIGPLSLGAFALL